MSEERGGYTIRPGTIEDNHACAAVLTEARVAVTHVLARGYRMDPFMTLICSSAPFGRFDRYLFCAPALIL